MGSQVTDLMAAATKLKLDYAGLVETASMLNAGEPHPVSVAIVANILGLKEETGKTEVKKD